jgi:putative transposase
MQITEKETGSSPRKRWCRSFREICENGVKVTLSKYDLYPATYYYWKKKLVVHGEDGLNHRTLKQQQAEIKKLEKENEVLKILVAEKELEGKLKDEMLKKKYPELRKNR